MPDWRALVENHLGRTDLSLNERQAVLAELVGHLQDLHEALLSEGIADGDAVKRVLEELGNADQLGFKICAAKHEEDQMNRRTRCFWLPSLITLTGSLGWLWILQTRNWPMSSALFHASPPIIPFGIWLCTLPIFGALGAYLSKRAGGSIRARLGVAVFPSIALVGPLLFTLAIAFFIEKNPFIRQNSAWCILIFIPWVVCPFIALLAGCFLLQGLSGRQSISQ